MEPTAPASRPTGAAGDNAGAKRSQRGRKWALAGIVVVLLAAVFVFSGGGSAKPDFTMSFVGFSNYNGKTHAFVWLTNGSRPAIWWLMPVCRSNDGRWVMFRPKDQLVHAHLPRPTTGQIYRPPHLSELNSFEVGEAKLPLRVWVMVRERSSGLTGMREAVQEWYSAHMQQKPRLFPGGQRYSVTNEFWPER